MAKLLIACILLGILVGGCASSVELQRAEQISSWGSYEVIDQFQHSGVAAGASRLLAIVDLSDLYILPAEAHEFNIVLLGIGNCMPCKGRVYSFAIASEAEEALSTLMRLVSEGESDFGWVYGRDNVVVVIDQNVPEEWAEGYRSALMDMGE
jgi:uncharacterized protein YceK